MSFRLLVLFTILLVAGCSTKTADGPGATEVQDEVTEQPAPNSDVEVASNPSADDARQSQVGDNSNAGATDVAKVKDAKPDMERALKDAEAELASLVEKYETVNGEWRKARADAKTPEQRRAWSASNPAEKFGEAFVALAQANEGNPVEYKAWSQALINGDHASEKLAMAGMMKIADTDPKSQEAVGTYVFLTQFGSGEHQETAMNRLLEITKSNLESNNSSLVANGETMLVQLIANRGSSSVKKSASELMLNLCEKDVRSNLSADRLSTIATQGVGPCRLTAIEHLLEHHPAELVEFVDRTYRSPTMMNIETEKGLKAICRKGKGHIQDRAAVALARFVARRDKSRAFYASASDEALSGLGDERRKYIIDFEVDPDESAELEAMLSQYVSNNSEMIDSAKKELFALQYLSVGKVAPDIVGNDLDGVEFKLSDYRGKIVFLDFWGDW